MPRDAYPHPAPHDPAGLVNHTHRRPLETNVQSCKHPHRCSPSFARGITSGKGRLFAGEQQPHVWDVLATNPSSCEKSYESSASPMITKRPFAASIPPISAAPYLRSKIDTTRAPRRCAVAWEPSVEPLSAINISPRM